MLKQTSATLNFSAVAHALSACCYRGYFAAAGTLFQAAWLENTENIVSSGNHCVRPASAEGQHGYLFNILLFLRFS